MTRHPCCSPRSAVFLATWIVILGGTAMAQRGPIVPPRPRAVPPPTPRPVPPPVVPPFVRPPPVGDVPEVPEAGGPAPADPRARLLDRGSNTDLPLLTTLSQEEAERLVRSHAGRCLALDGLTTLDRGVAVVLARHDGPLSLNGLTRIPFAFTTRTRFTSLDGVTSLGTNLGRAETFTGDVSLGGLVEISTGQLRQLLQSEGSLWLDGLERVTDDDAPARFLPGGAGSRLTPLSQAESLRQRTLSCARLADLSPAVAGIIAAQPHVLLLDRVTELDLEAAEALSTHAGFLALDGLRTLPDDVAEALARHRGPLSMAALDTLTNVALAEKLVRSDPAERRHVSKLVRFTGCPQFVPRYEANSLGIGSRLEALTADIAGALARSSRDLCLDRVTTIDRAVADALQPHGGLLSLAGLATVPDDVAESLAAHAGPLALTGLERLTNTRLAAKLAAAPGRLSLPRLRDLDATIAAELVAEHGDVSLDALGSLSVEVARALAPHGGTVRLPSVTAVSDEVARALANFRGGVALEGLEEVSDDGLAALLTNPRLELPERFRPAPPPEPEEPNAADAASGVETRRYARWWLPLGAVAGAVLVMGIAWVTQSRRSSTSSGIATATRATASPGGVCPTCGGAGGSWVDLPHGQGRMFRSCPECGDLRLR